VDILINDEYDTLKEAENKLDLMNS